jgi:hypothetical protein
LYALPGGGIARIVIAVFFVSSKITRQSPTQTARPDGPGA